MRAFIVVLVCSVAGALATASPSLAVTEPQVTCNGGSCDGWFRSDVSLAWAVEAGWQSLSCNGDPVTTDGIDQPSNTRTCSATYPGGVTVGRTVHVARDVTPPQVTSISAGRDPDANGWYNHSVTVTFSGSDATSGVASCDAPAYAGPDNGAATIVGRCRDVAGNTSATGVFALKYDSTAPSAAASLGRVPDSNGWYAQPVSVSFVGGDTTSGIASCVAPLTYSGPDAGAASVTGECKDVAGNSAPASATLRYDSTPPSAVATPARSPDSDGWYSRPLSVSFTGTDSVSGVASCTSPVTYARPDRADAKVAGACRDEAGNLSTSAGVVFKFDSTPPSVPKVALVAGDGGVTLTWPDSQDTTRYVVLRRRDGTSTSPSILWRGTVARFVDRAVKNGTRYRYVVRAIDQAGNTAAKEVAATPLVPVFAPAAGSVTRVPPLVRWADKEARFYNVQVFRGRKKLLSLWPSHAPLRLPRTWVHAGVRRTLEAGTYRIFVWPAFGTQAHPRYGKLLGQTSFVWRS